MQFQKLVGDVPPSPVKVAPLATILKVSCCFTCTGNKCTVDRISPLCNHTECVDTLIILVQVRQGQLGLASSRLYLHPLGV